MIRHILTAAALVFTAAPALANPYSCFAETASGELVNLGHLCPNPIGQNVLDNIAGYRAEATRLGIAPSELRIDELEGLALQLQASQRPFAGDNRGKDEMSAWEWALATSW